MAGEQKEFTHLWCATAPDGKHGDTVEPGLQLIVRSKTNTRSWAFEYTSPVTGKPRNPGLGGFRSVTLAQARAKAKRYRAKVDLDIDPLEEKAKQRADTAAQKAAKKAAVARERHTLLYVVRHYHEREVEPNLTRKHAAQWLASIEQHVPAKLLNAPIDTIEPGAMLDALIPIHKKTRETGQRIRQRLDTVFDDAVLRKIVLVNPMKSLVRALKPKGKGKRLAKKRFRALPFDQIPALIARLRGLPGNAARALEFGILCAARTSEITGMVWSEVSRDGKTWTIPAERMKAAEEHVVYLSDAAQAVLAQMRKISPEIDFVFPSPTLKGRPLSNMAMLTLLRRLELDKQTTVHGACRSCLSTWANAHRVAHKDAIEACLAHGEADKVEAAYNRSKSTIEFAEERRELLQKWATFAAPMDAGAKVLKLKRR